MMMFFCFCIKSNLLMSISKYLLHEIKLRLTIVAFLPWYLIWWARISSAWGENPHVVIKQITVFKELAQFYDIDKMWPF